MLAAALSERTSVCFAKARNSPMIRPMGSVQSASVMVTKKPRATSSPQPVSPQESSDPSGSRLRMPTGPQNGSSSDTSA
jgi:hypothetical protein